MKNAEGRGCSTAIHSWTHPEGSRAEVPVWQQRNIGLGNASACWKRKEMLRAEVRSCLQGFQGNTCVVVITNLTPEILLEKQKNPPKKPTTKAKPRKVLLGNSLRRVLVPGSIGADDRRALLRISNFTLEFGSCWAQRKTVCKGLIRITEFWLNAEKHAEMLKTWLNAEKQFCPCVSGLKSSAEHYVSIWKLLQRVWVVVYNLTSSLVLLFCFLE